MARGIFPGARVVRGVDWQWEDQDGKILISILPTYHKEKNMMHWENLS